MLTYLEKDTNDIHNNLSDNDVKIPWSEHVANPDNFNVDSMNDDSKAAEGTNKYDKETIVGNVAPGDGLKEALKPPIKWKSGSSDGDGVADLTLAKSEKKFEPQDSDKPDTDDDGEGLEASAESDLPPGVPGDKDLAMVTRNSETHHNSSICTKNKENFQQQSLEINGSRESCLEPKLSKGCASPRNILHGERLEAKLCRYML